MASIDIRKTLRELSDENVSLGSKKNILSTIQNDIVGDASRKKIWLQFGIFEVLGPLLNLPVEKSISVRGNVPCNPVENPTSTTNDETTDILSITLCSLHIISSYTNRTTIFLNALYASGIFKQLIGFIDHTLPLTLVLQAAKIMADVGDLLHSSVITCSFTMNEFSDALFEKSKIVSLIMLLLLPLERHGRISGSISHTICTILHLFCVSESYQITLAEHGVLDALSTMVAGYVIAHRWSVPEVLIDPSSPARTRREQYRPNKTPETVPLGVIFHAASIIIGKSKYRSYIFLSSPSITTLFPTMSLSSTMTDPLLPSSSRPDSILPLRQSKQIYNATDFLLPTTPSLQLASHPTASNPQVKSTPERSGFFAWIIRMCRAEDMYTCLMACKLFAMLFRSGVRFEDTVEKASLIVLPTLLYILSQHKCIDFPRTKTSDKDSQRYNTWLTTIRVLDIFTALLDNEPKLQLIAADAGVISIMLRILRDAYQPTPEAASSACHAHFDSASSVQSSYITSANDVLTKEEEETVRTTRSRRYSHPGLHPYLGQRIICRDKVLRALLSASSRHDRLRKMIIANEGGALIMQSLVKHPRGLSEVKTDAANGQPPVIHHEEPDPVYGTNPPCVTITALKLLRNFSRSHNLSKTALTDLRLIRVIPPYLANPIVEIQIAAVGLLCNLISDPSVLDQSVPVHTIMNHLCKFTRSNHPELRRDAMWGLKLLILNVPVSDKYLCMITLGPDWLAQLLSVDHTSSQQQQQQQQPTEGSGPRDRVSVTADDEDVDMDATPRISHIRKSVVQDLPSGSSIASLWTNGTTLPVRVPRVGEHQQVVKRMFEEEARELLQKKENVAVAVQEQALDFLRNYICSPGASEIGDSYVSDMIDFLFKNLGQERLFQILESNLRQLPGEGHGETAARNGDDDDDDDGDDEDQDEDGAKHTHPNTISEIAFPYASSSPTPSSNGGVKSQRPHIPIIRSSLALMSLFAASMPKHRQLIISRAELLRLALRQAQVQDPEISFYLCVFAANLLDATDDLDGALSRARILRELGYAAYFEYLEHESTFTLREHAHTVMERMNVRRPDSSENTLLS